MHWRCVQNCWSPVHRQTSPVGVKGALLSDILDWSLTAILLCGPVPRPPIAVDIMTGPVRLLHKYLTGYGCYVSEGKTSANICTSASIAPPLAG